MLIGQSQKGIESMTYGPGDVGGGGNSRRPVRAAKRADVVVKGVGQCPATRLSTTLSAKANELLDRFDTRASSRLRVSAPSEQFEGARQASVTWQPHGSNWSSEPCSLRRGPAELDAQAHEAAELGATNCPRALARRNVLSSGVASPKVRVTSFPTKSSSSRRPQTSRERG